MQRNLPDLTYESHFASLPNGDRIHLRRIFADAQGIPVLLVHGAVENGRIFYTESGKGYAPFLARHGYDVFVADKRGCGLSTPPIGGHSHFGLREFISEDLLAMHGPIRQVKGEVPIHWGAHSWGGVMLFAFLARHAAPLPLLSIVNFGAKRRISVRNFPYWLKMTIGWNKIGAWRVRRVGFLDAKRWRMGSDNESGPTYKEMTKWIHEEEWQDWYGDFDYSAALQAQNLPPALHLAGAKDKFLGHPTDVRILMEEVGEENGKFHLLSRANGHLRDYGHIDMLTYSEAGRDHFPMALEWMRKAEILAAKKAYD